MDEIKLPDTIYVTASQGYDGSCGSWQNHQSFYKDRVEYHRAQPSEPIDWDALRSVCRVVYDKNMSCDHFGPLDTVIDHLKSNGYLIKKPKE